METRMNEGYNPELYRDLCNIMELSPYSSEQTARLLIGEMVTRARMDGMSQQEIAAILEQKGLVNLDAQDRRKVMNVAPTERPSMVKTRLDRQEIEEKVELLNLFLLFSEMVLSGIMEKYARSAYNYMQEAGILRHQMKKHAGVMMDIIKSLQQRCNWNDREVTLEQCISICSYKDYAKTFYEEGGSFLNRIILAFKKEYELKIKRLHLDNKWLAESLGAKHLPLVTDLFTLTALAQTDIELYNEVQRQKYSIARGRGRFRSIKSMHCEGLENAARNILEPFVKIRMEGSTPQCELMRKHLGEFQKDVTSKGQFELFESQMMGLQMDFIEFMLAMMRMQMEKGKNTLPFVVARLVRHKMGNRSRSKQAMKELMSIKLPKKEMDLWDYSKKVATAKGNFKALNTLRKLLLDGQYLLDDRESQEEMESRILRTAARRNGGLLSDDDLGQLMMAHGTKKAVMEKLSKAGFELDATLAKVRKMKASELKMLASVNKRT